MARVSLFDGDESPEIASLAERLRGVREGRLINIYRMLLHSPLLAHTWVEHLNGVRWGTELDGATRELVIIRIGYLNRVDYVIQAHVPRLALPEGLSEAQCAALADDWQGSSLFSDEQRAVLQYTDAMTRDVQVPDAVADELKRYFSERQIVELSVLIGTYNMHTRVLAALQVDPEPPR